MISPEKHINLNGNQTFFFFKNRKNEVDLALMHCALMTTDTKTGKGGSYFYKQHIQCINKITFPRSPINLNDDQS